MRFWHLYFFGVVVAPLIPCGASQNPCQMRLEELVANETKAIAVYGIDAVGVAAVVVATRGDKILLGQRTGSTEAGKWAFVGGKMDANGENLQETAIREFLEETGIRLEPNRLDYLWRDDHLSSDGRYYSTYFFHVNLDESEEPKLMESHRSLGWKWFSTSEIPARDELFSSNQKLLSSPAFLSRVGLH